MNMNTASNYPGGRRRERHDIGYLPKHAITEWLLADASASVKLHEDSCGNLATPTLDHVYVRTVDPKNGAKTNAEWAKAEVKLHNIEHPLDPWIIRHSHKKPEYICICRAQPGEIR